LFTTAYLRSAEVALNLTAGSLVGVSRVAQLAKLKNLPPKKPTGTASCPPELKAKPLAANNAPAAAKPVDVALGLDTIGGKPALNDFARMTGAHRDNAWRELGLHDVPAQSGRFDLAFEQSLTKVVKDGGKIKFNLDSLDVPKALAGDPKLRYTAEGSRMTEWELQQIVRSRQWLDSTEFYLNGKKLTADEVKQLGLSHVP
jgi:hypothetical protein